jgi:hypothetical protein
VPHLAEPGGEAHDGVDDTGEDDGGVDLGGKVGEVLGEEVGRDPVGPRGALPQHERALQGEGVGPLRGGEGGEGDEDDDDDDDDDDDSQVLGGSRAETR